MLTARQLELLTFIAEYIAARGGIAPSLADIQAAMGWASRSVAHRAVESLIARGYLRRVPRRARAIEVLRLPTDAPLPLSAHAARYGESWWRHECAAWRALCRSEAASLRQRLAQARPA